MPKRTNILDKFRHIVVLSAMISPASLLASNDNSILPDKSLEQQNTKEECYCNIRKRKQVEIRLRKQKNKKKQQQE